MCRPTSAKYYVGVANGPHPESFAMWDHVSKSEVEEYAELLQNAQNERPLQAFFYLHRHFLVEHLRGGHGRWAIPKSGLDANTSPIL